MMRTQGVRHAGSAVLDLCYVACGRVDGLWEFGLRPRDASGGGLIVAEAGGRVTIWTAQRWICGPRHSLVNNRKLHRAMRETIIRIWPEADRREAAKPDGAFIPRCLRRSRAAQTGRCRGGRPLFGYPSRDGT